MRVLFPLFCWWNILSCAEGNSPPTVSTDSVWTVVCFWLFCHAGFGKETVIMRLKVGFLSALKGKNIFSYLQQWHHSKQMVWIYSPRLGDMCLRFCWYCYKHWKLWKSQQQHLFPGTVSLFLRIIHRACCEQFSLKVLPTSLSVHWGTKEQEFLQQSPDGTVNAIELKLKDGTLTLFHLWSSVFEYGAKLVTAPLVNLIFGSIW